MPRRGARTPRSGGRQSQRQQALHRGITTRSSDFAYMCKSRPDRISIVAEGDSWFAYPRKYLLLGDDANLLHHLKSKVAHSDRVNLLVKASNGDEAVAMTSGKQKLSLAKVMAKNGDNLDIVFFSGGGNDIVGDYDMDRLLRPFKEGFSAADCLHKSNVARKMQRIKSSYEELLDMRNNYAPKAWLVTHCYDHVQPSRKGAELLKFYKNGPWILPYLLQKNIPEALHKEVARLLLNELAQTLLKLQDSSLARGRFKVVQTQGTLRPGHRSDWINEIHPSSQGFKRLFRKIYKEMHEAFPALPY